MIKIIEKIIREYDKKGNLIKETIIKKEEKTISEKIYPYPYPYPYPYDYDNPTIWEEDLNIKDIKVTWNTKGSD